jgi:hypothetical protein
MKKNKYCLTILILSVLFTACNKTSILDQTPQDKYSDAVLWSDIGLADAYLLDTYHGTRIGFNQTMLCSITDDAHSTFTHGAENYVEGIISPDNTDPWDGTKANLPNWSTYFLNIQKINIFLSKIDGLAQSYPEAQRPAIKTKTDIMKGEALFLRAFCYTQLARTYGGVPILKEPASLGDDFTTIPRSSFEEVTQFIAADCDASAALLLGKNEMPLGRATKGAALALKSRMLLFAASDLTADGSSADKYVGYENPDRNQLWKAAKEAAKAVIDLGSYKLTDFGAPDKALVSQNYFEFFKAKDLSSDEIIWGKMYSNEVGDKNEMNHFNEGNGWDGWSSNAPLQNLVDAYEMEDGSDFFDHFQINAEGYYVNKSNKYKNVNPYYSRDPRFYGSILYDSAVWRPRDANFQSIDPLGIYSRRTKIVVANGTTTTTFGLDTRQGPQSSWNGSYTGYVIKKMLDNTINYKLQNNENVWIEIRYPEILLNYAEACLELGESGEAATYINEIRNRAGMPDFTGDITAALRYERRIELAFENIRWYDIRRWKIADNSLSDAKGMDIAETNRNGVITTTWKLIDVEDRVFDPKMYWVPISTNEIKKDPALVQNPGY